MGGAQYAIQPTTGGLESATPSAVRSLLMVDCGSAFTKVALAGLIEERFRLIARGQAATTSVPPVADIVVGVRDAIEQIERTIGRPLLSEGELIMPEQDDGSGVDALTLAINAGGPLRLVTTGPGREALAGLLYRAIGGLFVELDTLPQTTGEPEQAEWQRLVAQVGALHPHGVLVIGAPFGAVRGQTGDIDLTASEVFRVLDALHAAPSAAPSAAPVILFTGSREDANKLSVGAQQRNTHLQAVEMLSPSTLGPLSRATGALYETSVLRQVPGYDRLRPLSATPPLSTDTALGGVVRYLAQHYHMTVMGVDVGASSTCIAAATAQGMFIPADAPNAGVGFGAESIWRATGPANILRWLPWTASESEVREYVLTRMLRRHSVPGTGRELAMEYALAREAIRIALHAPGSRLAGLHPVDVVLGTGGVLAHTAQPGQAALLLLDAIQPRGITSLVVDSAGLATMLGTIPGIAPQAAAELTETDAVPLVLGSVISTGGQTQSGEPAVRVVLEFADGRQQVEDVAAGTLLRLPLRVGERAALSLYPAPTIDIGLGAGQHARASEPLEGGALGLVVDARGRPLVLPTAAEERIDCLRRWQQALELEQED